MRKGPRERLDQIVRRRGLSRRKAAAQLEVQPCVLTQILKNGRPPSKALAAVIESWTGGAIKAAEWLPPEVQERVRRVARDAA